MTIFVSYSRKQEKVASEVVASLAVRDFLVFHDKSSLKPGLQMDHRIEKEIKDSELFIFLLSPNSLSNGSYAVTELKFAKSKWKNPSGKILPVMVVPTLISDVDPYLKVVTILYPQGNIAAEVASRAAEMLSKSDDQLTTDPLRVDLQKERIQIYTELWRYTGLLPKWPRAKNIVYEDLRQLCLEMRGWYFDNCGGMYLSKKSMASYAALQDSLTAINNNNFNGTISDSHYDAIRDLMSSLRRTLAHDIGGRL